MKDQGRFEFMTTQIDVFSSTQSVSEEDLRKKTVVVIDVLRATSTIVTALASKARGVIAVRDMNEASKMAMNLDASRYMLCGEKDGIKIEGYDLGNSPLEYTRPRVEGKTLILNTSNGTKAISKASGAKNVIIGSFLNLNAVVEALREIDNDIVLVCSGWKGRISLEDLLCAGQILYELWDQQLPVRATDGAKAAYSLYEKFGDNIEEVVQQSNHAVRLKGLVQTDDVTYCCQLNKLNILPVLKEGIITDTHGQKERIKKG